MGILVWPFKALWSLVGFVIELTGRFIAIALGVVLMIVGALLTASVIGAVVGVPLLAFGLLLVGRGLF